MTSDVPVPFPYMRWAKQNLTGHGPFNLGMSGIAELTTSDVPLPEGIGYWAPEGEYGDPALRALIAARYGVRPEQVFVSAGTSLANFLVYLAEARGGHVAVETPGYEALLMLPSAVGAKVSAFVRSEERGWRIDPVSLRKAVRKGTRLIVVTNLHNPSGTLLSPTDIDLLVSEAERVDAAVLVDEVYLDFALVPQPTAALRHPRVLVTNSLTKAHGLGGLRVGWVLADPARIDRIAKWNDLVCPAHPVLSLAVAKSYLPRADEFLAKTRAGIAARLAIADAWVRSRTDVFWHTPAGGLTGFLRLPAGMDGCRLAAHAAKKHGVGVIPGSFFQCPDHVRFSYGLDSEDDLRGALAALGRAIDDLYNLRTP